MNKSLLLIISIILLISIPISAHACQDIVNPELEALEELANRQMEAGNYEPAHAIYLSFESELKKRGLNILNESLLMNEAIAAYHGSKPGWGVAHLQQLHILNHSEDVWQMSEELQSLIEHRIYQKAPNTEFVRGESEAYSKWAMTHHYTETRATIYFFIAWFSFFIVLSTLFIFQRGTRRFRTSLWISGIFLVLTMASGLLLYQRHQTDELRFGVLLDNAKVYSKPIIDNPPEENNGFIAGMTVSLVTTIPGWTKVARFDGAVGWVRSEDCYLLRGKGDQHSWRIEE